MIEPTPTTQAPAETAPPGESWARRLKLKSWGAYLVATLIILAIWEAAALALPSFLMPDVPVVLARLGRELTGAEFYQRVLGSLMRLAIGYGAALALGTLLGLLASASNFMRRSLKALVVILQSIPSIAWVPLFLILMGFGNLPIIVVVGIAAFFPTALSVMNATESVSKVHLQAAQVMGAQRWQLIRRVYAPAVTPELITGAQVAFGNAWRALISAEMLIGFGEGIGRSLAYSGEIADMPGVLTGILVIAVLAALIDQVILEGAKRRLLRYRYE
ncbi:MAG TPA: ABC transporter permease [Trueperaceae bacterium]